MNWEIGKAISRDLELIRVAQGFKSGKVLMQQIDARFYQSELICRYRRIGLDADTSS